MHFGFYEYGDRGLGFQGEGWGVAQVAVRGVVVFALPFRGFNARGNY